MERRVVYLANPCAPGRNPEPAPRFACRATLQMVEAGGVSRMLERCGQGAGFTVVYEGSGGDGI